MIEQYAADLWCRNCRWEGRDHWLEVGSEVRDSLCPICHCATLSARAFPLSPRTRSVESIEDQIVRELGG